jgi:hypothetical protein
MAWPWARWAERAREVEVMVPSASSAPVFEGLRVGRGKAEQVRYHEFGRIVQWEGERRIGRRAHGFPVWELLGEQALRTLDLQPSELDAGANWPDEDEAELALVLESHIDHVLGKNVASYGELEWIGASDAWLTRWWPRVEKQVRTGLARSTAEQTYPLVVDGTLTLASGKALARRTARADPRRLAALPRARAREHAQVRRAARGGPRVVGPKIPAWPARRAGGVETSEEPPEETVVQPRRFPPAAPRGEAHGPEAKEAEERHRATSRRCPVRSRWSGASASPRASTPSRARGCAWTATAARAVCSSSSSRGRCG